jgi:hypothetical protein
MYSLGSLTLAEPFVQNLGYAVSNHQLRFIPFITPGILSLKTKIVLRVKKSEELLGVEVGCIHRSAFA